MVLWHLILPLDSSFHSAHVFYNCHLLNVAEDAPSKAAKKAAEDAEKRPANIRVMEVQFFSNNTFATVAGLGESILRGKFHIIGEKRDQLSMRISRFGFGRSVSGSVYR
jgi:hypothetical protein